MKKEYIKRFLVVILVAITTLSACKKYSYYQNNPNKPTVATPALLLTNLCGKNGSFSLFYQNFSQNGDGAAFACRYLAFFGASGSQEESYSWTTGSYDNYDLIRNANQMGTLAQSSGQPVYTGLTHFFRAVLFSQLTEMFGDIPYSNALQATSGNVTPTYDKQEDVYVGILNELDQANTILGQAAASGVNIGGDIIYNGSPSQWQKAVNAFKLRLLIHLSKKTGDTKLNVMQQFQKLIANNKSNPTAYPLMNSIADNAQLVYNTSDASNYYPTYGFTPVTTLMSLESGIVDTLKAKEDPRLFVIAQPSSGLAAGVYPNYSGVNVGLASDVQNDDFTKASIPAVRYQGSQTNEPTILIGYPEQEFIISEAITRGWITAGPGGNIGVTAQDCYDKGITGSMEFYNTWASAGISSAAEQSYYQQASVALDKGDPLIRIATQKYISMFLQSDFEPFIEQRRMASENVGYPVPSVGTPTFDAGVGTLNGGKVPLRWQYPSVEYEQNGKNVNAAVQSQGFSADDINQKMWLLQ